MLSLSIIKNKHMENTTVAIDILHIQKVADTYIVEYWDENHNGESNAKIQINQSVLWAHAESVYDDFDFMIEEHLRETIRDYITFNS